jgi:hypothetical protein
MPVHRICCGSVSHRHVKAARRRAGKRRHGWLAQGFRLSLRPVGFLPAHKLLHMSGGAYTQPAAATVGPALVSRRPARPAGTTPAATFQLLLPRLL